MERLTADTDLERLESEFLILDAAIEYVRLAQAEGLDSGSALDDVLLRTALMLTAEFRPKTIELERAINSLENYLEDDRTREYLFTGYAPDLEHATA